MGNKSPFLYQRPKEVNDHCEEETRRAGGLVFVVTFRHDRREDITAEVNRVVIEKWEVGHADFLGS